MYVLFCSLQRARKALASQLAAARKALASQLAAARSRVRTKQTLR